MLQKLVMWSMRSALALIGHNRQNKGLQKVVRCFPDADDNPDSHKNLIITFWPVYNVP